MWLSMLTSCSEHSRVGGALGGPDVVLEEQHEDGVVLQRGEVLLVIHLRAVLLDHEVHLQPLLDLELLLG